MTAILDIWFSSGIQIVVSLLNWLSGLQIAEYA